MRIDARIAGSRAATAGLLLLATAACSESPRAAPKAGEAFEISRTYETAEQRGEGSSGSSNGRDVVLERVIAVRDGGLELEYDLPAQATAQDRARQWQFPARIFRAADGSTQLLNGPDLEARVDAWLEAAKMTREACGRWIFTWNAFRIDCDPATVLATIDGFDLRSTDLRDGAAYEEPGTRGPGTLTKTADGPDGATFVVELDVDPDVVRRSRAEGDVAIGEMMQKPVTLDAALRERAKEAISGRVTITFDADAAGALWRRTEVMVVETTDADGTHGRQTMTETLERRPVSTTE